MGRYDSDNNDDNEMINPSGRIRHKGIFVRVTPQEHITIKQNLKLLGYSEVSTGARITLLNLPKLLKIPE